jgi:tRNA(fMet)-specific endonuclease VapC
LSYLLDTNTCIRYLSGRSQGVIDKIHSTLNDEIALCSVVRAELYYGAERTRNPIKTFARLEEFLMLYKSLPFDDECASVYGRIRARLARVGIPIGPNDLFIAATAVAFGAVLVTHNTREFSRVEGLHTRTGKLLKRSFQLLTCSVCGRYNWATDGKPRNRPPAE